MMRFAVILGIFGAWLHQGLGHAASLYLVSLGNDTMAVYLDGETLNGEFDTIVFTARMGGPISMQLINAGAVIQQMDTVISLADPFTFHWDLRREFGRLDSGAVAGIPRPPGQQATYINRMLNADPLDVDGGMAWNILGLTRTPTEVSFAGGPPVGKINTASEPDGRLFLANFYVPIPEPATAGLASLAVLALAAICRGVALN